MIARMESAVVVILPSPMLVSLTREKEDVEWVSSGDGVRLIQARWNDYDYAILLVPLSLDHHIISITKNDFNQRIEYLNRRSRIIHINK